MIPKHTLRALVISKTRRRGVEERNAKDQRHRDARRYAGEQKTSKLLLVLHNAFPSLLMVFAEHRSVTTTYSIASPEFITPSESSQEPLLSCRIQDGRGAGLYWER